MDVNKKEINGLGDFINELNLNRINRIGFLKILYFIPIVN